MKNIKLHMKVEQTTIGKINEFIAIGLVRLGVIGKGRLINKLLFNRMNYKFKTSLNNKWTKLNMSHLSIEVTKG